MIIYKATNRANGKIYVGQTLQTLRGRIQGHKKGLSGIFSKAIRKYGIGSFDFEVIDSACSISDLNKKECAWIAHYNCKNPNGYNMNDGGGGNTGWTASPDIRDKIRKSKLGQARSAEVKAKLRAFRLGKKASDELKAKLSAIHTLRQSVGVSPETSAKLSLLYQQRVANGTQPSYAGRTHSEATRQRISRSQKGKVISPESIEKMRQSKLGKSPSIETRQKMSDARCKYLAGLTAVDQTVQSPMHTRAEFICVARFA
jgi:group I intron endonuclease